MRKLVPAYLPSQDVGLKCSCGLVFPASEFTGGGLCPECRLAEIMVKEDMGAPDRACLTYDGPLRPIFKI